VLNAANEVAVAAFLAGHIRFTDIAMLVEDALGRAAFVNPASIDDVLQIDRDVRAHVDSAMKASCS
jgi:1-deoxy-D-xylulose-5-phosphate reductoisomerase